MEKTLNILKALADRNRLRLITALAEGPELCSCQLTELLQVRGATVSNHMKILLNAGIVSKRKEGKWAFYRLSAEFDQPQLLNWLSHQLKNSNEIDKDRLALRQILRVKPEDICRKQRGADGSQ